MAHPRFTIIVPSYSGGEYLKLCVQSVLAQTYTNFNLAVLDNCSNDGSREWLASLNDSRIKVYTSETVLPIEQNWGRALEIPKNEFITFFGHDDMMDADYLAVMSALIDQYPDAGLYHAHFRMIDSEGRTLHSCRPLALQESRAEFLHSFLTWQIDANGTGYVMRAQSYDAVGGIPPFQNLLHADHALWFMLTQNSYKVTAPQECFSYRLHANSTSVSSNWQAHLKAIAQFISYLTERAHWEPEAQEVFRKHGPNFFAELISGQYERLLIQATKNNQRLDPRVFDNFAGVLSRVAPQKADELKASRRFRARRLINASSFLRLSYIAFIFMKCGRNGLPRGRVVTEAIQEL